MELVCLEDYSETNLVLKAGDCTVHVPSLTEEHKAKMLSDFPNKFEVVKETKKIKDSELVVENKEAKLSITKKSKV